MTTETTNMQELHRHLKAMNTIAPQMKRAMEAAKDHDDRLATLEQQMAVAYRVATETRDQRAEAVAAATRGGPAASFRAEHHQHADAFAAWLRAPNDQHAKDALLDAQAATRGLNPRAAGSTLSGPAGGFAVPEPVADRIQERILDISPMRRLAARFDVTSTGTKFLVNRNNATSAWVGETDPRADTSEPTLDLRAPTFGTVFGLVEATEELLLDSAVDIGAWFINAVSQQIAQAEGAAFVAGNGSDKPTGFLAGPTPVTTADATRAAGTLQYVPTGDAAAITVDSLTGLYFAAKAQHRQNGTWLMSSATAATIAKLRDDELRSFWQPSLSSDMPNTMLGRPVMFDENMPAITGDAFPVAFGDFSAGYLIADSGGMRITVDDNITKPGYVRFYVRRRVGGAIYDSDAIKLMKVAAT